MSRSYSSYDADWQRRKSLLIRSLFHDIPILSPVEEESSDSYNVPNQEIFASPPRPYSPLPPLIIEKVPITNKHDEPEEHYNKLYKKIKSIYTKLFIEKLNFSSIDYDSNYNDSSVNDDSDGSVENLDFHVLESNTPDNGNFDSIIDDREDRESSASTKSNGYGADFESMDTAIIDVVNYTTSNEDGLIISEEEESDSENNNEDGVRNEDSDKSRSSENKESSRERVDKSEFSEGEDSHHSIIDDHEMIESEESHQPEDEQSYEKEGSDNENIDEHEITEETIQTVESDTVRIDYPVFSVGDESHASIDDHENTESEESNVTEDERQSNNVAKSKQDSYEKELKSKEFEKTAAEVESNVIESNVEPMEGDIETSDDYSEGPIYRQITTSAMVHFDGSEDAGERESRIYEDSVQSVILPTRFRRVVLSRNVDIDDRIEDLPILEKNADSKTIPTFFTDESQTIDEDSDEVASPQLDAKDEEIIEMRTPQADAPEEDDEELSTPRLHGPEEDDEEMSTPDLHAPEEDDEEMNTPQLYGPEEDDEVSTPRLNALDEDDEEMSTPRLNAPGEMSTPELHAPKEDDEDMSTLRLHIPEEADEEMSTPRLNAPEEDDEELNTPRLNALEEMSTPQPDSVEDVEGMRSPQPAARDEEIKALEGDVEEMGSPHAIEQMRTPRPDLSHGTIPITDRSHSQSTSENTVVPQEPTTLTSSTQDGANHDMSEIQTSNDMNEILTSIFNESRNKDGTPRKRKLVDKSVQADQTSRVTWEEMRANFFVGTPKIFRLCACTDHICY